MSPSANIVLTISTAALPTVRWIAIAPATAIGMFRIIRTTKTALEIQPLCNMKNHSDDSIVKQAGTNHAATRNSRSASVASEYCGPLAITTQLRLKRHSRKLRRARYLQENTMLLGLVVTAAALVGGFVISRNFVRRRLRFVDAIQRPSAPLIAGVAVAAIALPVALLPVVTVGTAVALGVGVAGGVASGRNAPPAPPTS